MHNQTTNCKSPEDPQIPKSPDPQISRRPSLRRPRQRGAAGRGSARAASVQPIYVSVGLAWEQAERDAVAPASRQRARSAGACGRSSRCPSTCATSTRRRTGRSRDGRRRITRRTRTCTCRAGTSSCSARRACTAPPPASTASCSARSSTIRFPTRRRSSARRWRARCRSAWRIRSQIDAPYADIEQGRRHPPRRGARACRSSSRCRA